MRGFISRDKNHLKRDCPKKADNKTPKVCPCCHRGMHWAKECKSKFDIEGKPISGNSRQGTPPPPQVPFNKKQGQDPSFPSNPLHPAGLYASPKYASVDMPALNDFLLYP